MDEGLIHRTVIAPVENQNLRTSGDLPRQPDRKPIRVGGGQRELPVGQLEALLQFLGDDDGVFSRQHQSDPAFHLIFRRLHGREWRMSGHRSGITEAEVDVTVAVDVEEVRALRLAHEWRESSRPLHHPVHGHTSEQRFARALK